MHPDATRPDRRTIDTRILGVALGCSFFGFGAGVFYTLGRHGDDASYVVMGIFLALCVVMWAEARYFLHHPDAAPLDDEA